MDIKKLTQEVLLKNMTPEQQMAVLDSVQASVKEAKAVQKQKIAENVDLVLQALKRIESDMLKRIDGSAQIVENRVKTIKDGKDGKNGIDGKAGRDGKDGKNGSDGRNGKDGLNGVSGERGQDGVGVQNAHIDFDGSLIIALTDGRELNVGEVVPFDVAEKIRVIGNGGGTSQFVIDTLASLQTQIDNFQALPSQTGNSGKFLTTNGTTASWASVAGGLSYQGTWNASTNSPTLASSTGTNGYYYIVGTAGSTNLNGITDWQVGDWLLFNGATWQKLDQTNSVTSVAGRTGAVTLSNTDISGLGTMSTQAASNVAITGGTIDGTVIGGTTATTITGSTINANTKIVSPDFYAQSVVGGNLRTSGGTSLLNWDGGGSGNVTVNGGLTVSPSNKSVTLSPTGTGTVTVSPATAGTVDNVAVGATTAAAGTFTSLRLNTNLSLNGSTGTSGQVLTSAGSGLPTWTTPTTGTVTSVAALTLGTTGTDVSSSVANGTTTPVITLNVPTASATNRGALSSADWSTFNGKAPAVTYTTNYVPYGQGTTTPALSANFQYDGTFLRVGSTTPLTGATNPIVAATGGANQYIQSYAYNSTNGTSASADFVAYANNSTDAHGWADVGFTSQTYADTTYTVTGPNEAYLFGSAPSGSGKTGNLVYATDSTGTENVHQFYVGGFTQAKSAWKAKIDGNGLSATQLNATNGIIVNSKTVSANFTIASGSSAHSTGPITISSGVSVTVSSGSKWVVL